MKKIKISNLFLSALLVVVGFSVFANSLGNKMFWDDDDDILKNHYVQNFEFKKFFTGNLIEGAGLISNYWRPLLLTAFALEWKLWGSNPAGYHAVNTAFHVADAVLLFYILMQIFGSSKDKEKWKWLAFFTALIFLVHPLQTEAVSYVAGFGDSLSAFWVFLGLFLYLRFRVSKKPWHKSFPYCASIITYALALLSKDTAAIMPGLVFLADFFYLLRTDDASKGLWRTFWSISLKVLHFAWPFFALGAVYGVLRATVLNFQNTFNLYDEKNLFTQNIFVRLFTFFKVLLVYFGLLFVPLNLHMERVVNISTSLANPATLAGGLIFAGLIFFGAYRFQALSSGKFRDTMVFYPLVSAFQYFCAHQRPNL